MLVFNEIKKDYQIWKFCFYGFFKNLKFFEPYLLIYLIGMGLDLFQIGILYAIREGITYLFEVPSGIIADHYGKKKELLICFVFYIISFVLFFIGSNVLVITVGMIFYGLGEAFRSGTHKAMILSYLEHKGWYEHKGYVYGRTRSYSLLGSSLSSFLSILLVLNIPALRWIFLACIIPYILDFLLILSYPNELDEKRETEKSLKTFIKLGFGELRDVKSNSNLIKILFSSSTYGGVFKTIKDYIQPILSNMILVAGIGTLMNLDANQSVKVYLGLIYGCFYIFSSLASKNVHRLTSTFSSNVVFDRSFDIMGVLLLLLSFAVYNRFMVIAVSIYFVLYLLMDARRPVFFDVCSDNMKKEQRATVLSVESQIRAVLMIIMAPFFGLIAETLSISFLFLLIGILLLFVNRLFKR